MTPPAAEIEFQRGRIYAATISEDLGEKYYLVVSNNHRNKALGIALVVRLTTTTKPPLSSIIELPHSEPFNGRVLCDDILELYPDETRADTGALSAATMTRVSDGLRAALALD